MQLFQTMPCRVRSYEAALDGYEKTETHLIAFNDICNGGKEILTPAGYGDYVGSFLYIPYISNILNLNIEVVTKFFYIFYGLLCICLSLLGLYRFYKTRPALIHGTLSIIFVGLICIFISDTYSFYGLTSLGLVTWWSKIKLLIKENNIKFIIFFILTGLLIGFSNTVRGNSGSDVILSIFCVFILYSILNKSFSKFYIIILILVPILIINYQIDLLKNKSKDYLIKNTDVQKVYDLNFIRALWHNAYYGLGYLSINNKDVPEPHDVYSIKKAQEIKPNVILHSKEYEKILQNEYFDFVKNYPYLYIKIILSKMGVILFYFIFFLNIGIYFLFKKKVKSETILFFGSGILFNSLFGILAEPDYTYLLGLFAYSSLLGTKLIEDYFTTN